MSKANKTQATDASVQEFIAAIESPEMRADCERLVEMMSDATGEKPRLWGPSIVGFGEYHYKYESGREGDFLRVGFAPRKRNLSIYIMPGFDEFQSLMDRLGKHSTGASCLYVKRLADIDEKVLDELIRASLDEMRKRYG